MSNNLIYSFDILLSNYHHKNVTSLINGIYLSFKNQLIINLKTTVHNIQIYTLGERIYSYKKIDEK